MKNYYIRPQDSWASPAFLEGRGRGGGGGGQDRARGRLWQPRIRCPLSADSNSGRGGGGGGCCRFRPVQSIRCPRFRQIQPVGGGGSATVGCAHVCKQGGGGGGGGGGRHSVPKRGPWPLLPPPPPPPRGRPWDWLITIYEGLGIVL